MFALRALTAAVLLALLLSAALLLDATGFAVLIAAIVALGGHEWAKLTGQRGWGAQGYAATVVALFAVLWMLTGGATTSSVLRAIWFAAGVFWVLVVPLWMARGVRAEAGGALRLAGFAVLIPAGLAMTSLPPRLVLAVLAIVWIADTAAYLCGRAWGRHRLAPAVSPGKTWEGAAGGTVGALGYAIILAASWPWLEERVTGVGWAAYLGGVGLLGVISILGDLFESATKRQAGVKDSGSLLPGHGGVLDRIDSATAVLPVGALLAIGAGLA